MPPDTRDMSSKRKVGFAPPDASESASDASKSASAASKPASAASKPASAASKPASAASKPASTAAPAAPPAAPKPAAPPAAPTAPPAPPAAPPAATPTAPLATAAAPTASAAPPKSALKPVAASPAPASPASSTEEKIPVRVYGTKIMMVEKNFNKNEAPWTLKEAQTALATELRLKQYIDTKTDLTAPQKAKWLYNIVYEIVIHRCRDDPSIILKHPCPNFRAYLGDMALQLFKTKQIIGVTNPDVDVEGPEGTLLSVPADVKKAAAEAAKLKAEAVRAQEEAAEAKAAVAEALAAAAKTKAEAAANIALYGNLTVIIHIPMDKLKTPTRIPTVDTLNTLDTLQHRLYIKVYPKLKELLLLFNYKETDPIIKLIDLQPLIISLKERARELKS